MWTMTAYDYGSITQSPTSSVPYGRFDGLLHIFLNLLHTINNVKTAIVVILAILEGASSSQLSYINSHIGRLSAELLMHMAIRVFSG